jgi:hypothetical protein
MENVFEPMDNFVDEVFEPMSNFASKKTPEKKSDELSTILQKLKKVEDIEKVKTAVETGGLGAGTVLAKMFLEVQNKKSSFAGNQSFLNDPRIVWDLSIEGQLAKRKLLEKPNDYYRYILGTLKGQNINYRYQLQRDVANKIKSKTDRRMGLDQLLSIYLKEYGKPYEIDLSKYKLNSMPIFGIKKISYNHNNLKDILNPFYNLFQRIKPNLYRISDNIGEAIIQKKMISSFDNFENFEGDDFSNFGLTEWFKSKFSTQSTPSTTEEEKIFGMSKKRVITVGATLVVLGIATYFLMIKKTKK